MSLASAVVLLQTALSLLTLVNSNPSLPQSMRDNATAVAQQAISEAHAVLASTATSADVAEDDIASPADEAIAQAALAKTPSTQTVSLAPSAAKAGPAYLYPNPTLTPGAVLTTDASTICTPGYAASVRDVSTGTKEQVYAEYGVSYPQPTGAYEVDHFIRSKLAARMTSITYGWSLRRRHPVFIKKTSLKTSSTGKCATAS